MKIPVRSVLLLSVILNSLSCETESENLRKAEEECRNKKTIEGLNISFYGYFPEDADTVHVRIKRSGNFVEEYSDRIPDMISDSVRHIRRYYLNKEIELNDTVYLSIDNEPVKMISGFNYVVRPHFSMLKKAYGCDLFELYTDGKLVEGAVVEFRHKNWDFVEKEDFDEYYGRKK